MHLCVALRIQVKQLLRQDQEAGVADHCIMAWGCGANCAKIILIIINIVFLVSEITAVKPQVWHSLREEGERLEMHIFAKYTNFTKISL